MKKIILGLIILISIGFGMFMINKSNYIHSEAVFVATDSLTNLGFKLDGKIDKMGKEVGDKVRKGDFLASLETKTLQAKIDEVKFKIISIQYKLSSLSIQKDKISNELKIDENIIKNEINQTMKKVTSLEFEIKANNEKLIKLKFDNDKFYKLYKQNKISFDTYNSVKTEYNYLFNIIKSKQESLKVLKIALNSLEEKLKLNKNNYKSLDILDENIEELYNQKLALEETKKQLLIALKDSVLNAPFDGVIAKKFVNSSTVIEKGTFIYSIVNPENIYVKVLLSEKKLAGLKVGDKAVIKLDAFDEEFNGKVFKIMPVSASTFSLVPRDIASGEFTKLDQRFIVKIELKYNPKMRIGMGGEVKIYKDKK